MTTYRPQYWRAVTAALVLAIAAGTTAGLSGCSTFGGLVNKQLSTQDNLANQRKVAQQTIRDYPNPALESIRFVSEGHVDGAGAWAADAVLVIGGAKYEEVLGTFLSGGDALPTVPPGSVPGPVAVTYSDGTMEVLK